MPDSNQPAREYSCVLLKPDAVKKDVALHVLARLQHAVNDGMIRATRIWNLTPEMVADHYQHLKDKPYYPMIEKFMLSGPVWTAVIEGQAGTIAQIRDELGATDPRQAKEGTIRAQFGEVLEGENIQNIAHASDSIKSARIEIQRFFTRDEIENAMPELVHEIFEDTRFDVKG
ncbi:MAG TPA: nucleoside-diphosphate kinase [Candidatus Peribacteraceae bacterium]|nr:nucleoside-diphosphate kinase [Candidatus Peribacteraceae bacterium]